MPGPMETTSLSRLMEELSRKFDKIEELVSRLDERLDKAEQREIKIDSTLEHLDECVDSLKDNLKWTVRSIIGAFIAAAAALVWTGK